MNPHGNELWLREGSAQTPPRRTRSNFEVGIAGLLVVLATSHSALASNQAPSNQSGQLRERVAAEFQAICERQQRDSEFFGQALDDSNQPQGNEADLQWALALADDAVRLGDFDTAHRLTEQILSSAATPTGTDSELRSAAHRLQALALFLAAEDANCLSFTNAASCILPIRPEAVHQNKQPITAALSALDAWLDDAPTDPEARWLLNLSHMLQGSYPDSVPEQYLIPPGAPFDRSVSQTAGLPLMLNAGPALGVDARDHAGGAILDDFDGDGRLDLISSSWAPCSPIRAFRSNGAGGFDDVGERWGLDVQLGGLNLVHADVDNDGALDLLVLRGAWAGRQGQIRNSLLLNKVQQGLGFVDVTYSAGLAHPAAPTQAAAFADFDLDGDLDLYVGNESAVGSRAVQSFDVTAGRPYASQLFENRLSDGQLVFRDVARSAGVQNLSFAKGVAWGDVDNDGDPDLYVSNIGPNRLYLNLGNGRFRDVAEAVGVADPSRNFATWFFDYDNDGDLDLFNADYSAATEVVADSLAGAPHTDGHPRLYRNNGERFEDVSRLAGFSGPLLPMGANYGDLDGDGFLDIVLGTGVPDYSAVHPNVVYRNLSGQGFRDATAESGMGHLQKGHAVAFGDIDHDGDLDVFEQLGGAYPYDAYGNALYLNPSNEASSSRRHRFLVLTLRGTTSNHSAVGARVAVHYTDASARDQVVYRTVSSGGSFGGSSFRLTVGLGGASKINRVEVRWPGSTATTDLPGTAFDLDRAYRITQRRDADSPQDLVEQVPFEPIDLKPQTGASDHENH